MDLHVTKDTVEAATDTMIVVQSQSDTWLDWLSFVGTALVATFTGGYLYYTYRIYQETQRQARSAEQSAEASREAAGASQASLEEQKRVNEQRSIERTHPLLWLEMEHSNDGLIVRLENNSDAPAMDISTFICARYWRAEPLFGKDFSVDTRDEEEVLMGHEEYGVHTGLTTEVIEGQGTSWTHVEYAEPPVKLYVLIQYRSIHGENFGRYFEVVGSSSQVHTGHVESYYVQKTVPAGVSPAERYDWVWREEGKNRREMLVRKSDMSAADWDALNHRYIRSDDRLQAEIGAINAALTDSEDTRRVSDVRILARSEGSFPFEVWFPRKWDSYQD
ncbi:hypothetical protein [Salinibacter altiplanensis]|uniref:hypothetical protein n=1 Tax=Salinibacter altiplanensis TaxID=1803181 RepID=UPI000C9FC99A|nr:hypothetical protein [Salinibacter altiplanensis]